MMWRIAVIVGLIWGMAQVAWAEDVVPMGNDPQGAIDIVKDAVDALEPTVEAIYNCQRGQWDTGTSGSLYALTSNGMYLGRLKAGYLLSNAAYAGLDLDLPGLSARFLEGRWVQADRVLQATAKYAAVGFVFGYDTEEQDIVFGPSVGATIRF